MAIEEWPENVDGGYRIVRAVRVFVRQSLEQYESEFGSRKTCGNRRRVRGGQREIAGILRGVRGNINQACVVEVKSHPREEAIAQIKTLLERFRDYFPEHKDKAVYGILTAVDISAALRERALREGLYVALMHDNIFEMDTPDDFQPKAY